MTTDYRTEAERWEAVRARDTEARGAFVFAVRTTGVYCRPDCRSRLPLRANVRFYDSCGRAEAAGFRPCKRCTPAAAAGTDPMLVAVKAACRALEGAESSIPLAELAASARVSPYHFHRVFKQHIGVTPKQYALAHRARRYKDELAGEGSITEAIYEAGFASAARAYDVAVTGLGMTAGAYRAGGAGERIAFGTAATSLGFLAVAATSRGVCAIEFADDEEALASLLRARFPNAELRADEPALRAALAHVVRYLDRPESALDLPLDIRGTAFQQRVWLAVRRIPLGTTTTYGEIAASIGAPRATRAVASACAANPVALAIPCHRVHRADGGDGGYRWGVERKRSLVRNEGAGSGRLHARRSQ
jgi:AraC family transcriptional regulator, regulatory protein of adaptative response / methylated-DNA-[protein]-cysteine methyltransferase